MTLLITRFTLLGFYPVCIIIYHHRLSVSLPKEQLRGCWLLPVR